MADKSVNLSVLVDVLFQAGKVEYGKLATDLLKTLQKIQLPSVQLSPDITISPKSKEKLLKELNSLMTAVDALQAGATKDQITKTFTGETAKGKPARRLQAAEQRAVEFTEVLRGTNLPEGVPKPSAAEVSAIAKRYNTLFTGVRDVITREAEATKLLTSENLQGIVRSLGQGKISILDPKVTAGQKKAIREYIELQESFLKRQRSLIRELEKTPEVASLFGIDFASVKGQLQAAEGALRTLKRNTDETRALSQKAAKDESEKRALERKFARAEREAQQQKQKEEEKAYADRAKNEAAYVKQTTELGQKAIENERKQRAQQEKENAKAIADGLKQNEQYLAAQEKQNQAANKTLRQRTLQQTREGFATRAGIGIEQADPFGLKYIERGLKARQARLEEIVVGANEKLELLRRKFASGAITAKQYGDAVGSIARRRENVQSALDDMAGAFERVNTRQRELNELAKSDRYKKTFQAYRSAIEQESVALDSLATNRLRKLADKLATGKISFFDPKISAEERGALKEYVSQYDGFVRQRQNLINKLEKQPDLTRSLGVNLKQMRLEQREAKQRLAELNAATNEVRLSAQKNRAEQKAAAKDEQSIAAQRGKERARSDALRKAQRLAEEKATTLRAEGGESVTSLQYQNEALKTRKAILNDYYTKLENALGRLSAAHARGTITSEQWTTAVNGIAVKQKGILSAIQDIDEATLRVTKRQKEMAKYGSELRASTKDVSEIVKTGKFIERQVGGPGGVGRIEDLSDLNALRNYYGEKSKLLENQKRRYEDLIRTGKEFNQARYDKVTSSLADVNRSLLQTQKQIKIVRDLQLGKGEPVNAQWAAEGRRLIEQYGGIGRAARTVAKEDLPLVIEALRQNIRESKALRDVTARSGVAVSREDFKKASRAVAENNEALRVAETRFRGVYGIAEQTGRLLRQFTRYAIGYGALYQLLSGVTLLTRSVVELDQALRSIQAVTGATNTEMQAMGEAVKRVAQETQFSTSETAKAAQVLAQAGVDPKDMERNLRAVATLASATAAPIELASDIMSSVKNVYSELDERTIANLLTRTLNISKITAEDLKTIISLGAQTSRAYGITAKQFFAAAATLRNAGLKASTTATGYREALLEVFSPDTKTVKAWVKRYGEIGERMSEEAVRSMLFKFRTSQAPLEMAIGELRRLGFQGEGRAAFGRAFDRRAENALQALVNRYEELQAISRSLSVGEAAFEGAQVQMKGLQASLENLGGAMTVFAAEIGKGPIESLERLADSVTDVLERLTKLDIELKRERGSGLAPLVSGAALGGVAGFVTGRGAANRIARTVGGAVLGSTAASTAEKLASDKTEDYATEATIAAGTLLVSAITGRFRSIWEAIRARMTFSLSKKATAAASVANEIKPVEAAVAAGAAIEKAAAKSWVARAGKSLLGFGWTALKGAFKFTAFGTALTVLLNLGDILRSLPNIFEKLPDFGGIKDVLVRAADTVSVYYRKWFSGLTAAEAELDTAKTRAAAAKQIVQEGQNRLDEIKESFKEVKLSTPGYAAKPGTFAESFESFLDEVATANQKVNRYFDKQFSPDEIKIIKEKLKELDAQGYESGSEIRKKLQAELNALVTQFGGRPKDFTVGTFDRELSTLATEVSGLEGAMKGQLDGIIQLMRRLSEMTKEDLVKQTPVNQALAKVFEELTKSEEYQAILYGKRKATISEYISLIRVIIQEAAKQEAELVKIASEAQKQDLAREAREQLKVIMLAPDDARREQQLQALLATRDELTEAAYQFLLEIQNMLRDASQALAPDTTASGRAAEALKTPEQKALEEERRQTNARLEAAVATRVTQFQERQRQRSLQMQEREFKLLEAFVKDYNKPEFRDLLNSQLTRDTYELLGKLLNKNERTGQYNVAPNAKELLTSIDSTSLLPDMRVLEPIWMALATLYGNVRAQMSKDAEELQKEDERIANESLENAKNRFQEIADAHKDMLDSMKNDLDALEDYNKNLLNIYDNLKTSVADFIEDAEVSALKKKSASDIEQIKRQYEEFERYAQARIDSGKLSKRQQQELRKEVRAAQRVRDVKIQEKEDTTKRVVEEKVTSDIADHLLNARAALDAIAKVDFSGTGDELKSNLKTATEEATKFDEAVKAAMSRAKQLEDQGKVQAIGYDLQGMTEEIAKHKQNIEQRKKEVELEEKNTDNIKRALRELAALKEKVRKGEIRDPALRREIEAYSEKLREAGVLRDEIEEETQRGMVRRLKEYGDKVLGLEDKVKNFKAKTEGSLQSVAKETKKATGEISGHLTALQGAKIPLTLDKASVSEAVADAKVAASQIAGVMTKPEGKVAELSLNTDVARGQLKGFIKKESGQELELRIDPKDAEKTLFSVEKGVLDLRRSTGEPISLVVDNKELNQAVTDLDKLKQASEASGAVTINVDTAQVDQANAKVDSLNDQGIAVNVDVSQVDLATAKIDDLRNQAAADAVLRVNVEGEELDALAEKWQVGLGPFSNIRVAADEAKKELQFTSSLVDEVTGEPQEVRITANIDAVTQKLTVLKHEITTFKMTGETVTLQLDTSGAQAQLSAMQEHLNLFESKEIAVAVDTNQALFNLQELWNFMSLLVDKTITVTVRTVREGDTGLKKGGWAETAPPTVFARGGKVYGGYGGGDRIPALLEPGEFVVRKETASQHAELLQALNRQPSLVAHVDSEALAQLSQGGLVARYAEGGLVDYASALASVTGNVQQQRPGTTSGLRLQQAPMIASANNQSSSSAKDRVSDTVKVELAVGHRVAELFGRRDQVVGLTSALKEARRGY
jgi:TP901 family phage tail tape measure protein